MKNYPVPSAAGKKGKLTATGRYSREIQGIWVNVMIDSQSPSPTTSIFVRVLRDWGPMVNQALYYGWAANIDRPPAKNTTGTVW